MPKPVEPNPFTGLAPNQFTQVTNRTLPAPTSVREFEPEPGLRRRTRRAATDHLTGNASDAPMGYRMDGIDPAYRTFVTGANHILPNTAAQRGEPAINEPHAAHDGVTVQRRAEDLSGAEVRKGQAVLVQYGHDARNPMESLRNVQRRHLDHAIAQHIASGVEESASQMFYGGSPSTDITASAPEHQDAHDAGVLAARDRFGQGVREIATHPDFVAQTAHLSHRERMHAATNLMAQATADTSPNTKWRDVAQRKDGSMPKYPWPNMEQAEESAKAAIEDRPATFISGRVQNIEKAKGRVQDALDTQDYSVHGYGDPKSSAKTVAFRGALIDKDSPDAFKVTDIHEASNAVPWVDTAKGHQHWDGNAEERSNGSLPKKLVYADTPKAERQGLRPIYKQSTSKELADGSPAIVPEKGDSRPEAMLKQGGGLVHALNDKATRDVLAERGLSRGSEYADNVHTAQGMTWGLRQLARDNVNVSPADQYPVVRNWGSEGVNVPKGGDIRNMGETHTSLSPQFGANTRTNRTDTVWPEDSNR